MALRLPVDRIRKRLQKLEASVNADAFKPELLEFAAKTLTTCIAETPVRDESLIVANQKREYEHRVNYIPSIHWSEEPRMIVNENGVKLVAMNGRWYAPEFHHCPDEVQAAFLELNAERERRLQTAEKDFIDARKQARFLYQKSWWQVMQSLGIAVSIASQIIASVTRRWPMVSPPKAYGQIRGGKDTISVVVYNPFLEQDSRYKPFSGRVILSSAIARHKPEFVRKVENKVRRLIYAAKK